ncbi:hypothetical protein Holit_00068 [Hollandina sp. SP2]
MHRDTMKNALIRIGWAAEFKVLRKTHSVKQILEQLQSGKSMEEPTQIYEEELTP